MRVRAILGTQNDQEERWVFEAGAQTRSHKISTRYTAAQQQYSTSGTTAAVLQALAFTPVVTIYAFVLGTQQQQTEPRQH